MLGQERASNRTPARPSASTAQENQPIAKIKMECVLRAGIFKTLIECTAGLVTSANFIFDDDGMRMQAMDTAHVSLITLVLEPSAFSSYRCAEQSSLGIHLQALSNVLKTCVVDDMITLAWEHGGDHLTISRKDRQFDLKLLEVDEEITSVPELCYEVSATAPSSEFQKICSRDLKDIGGDTISICAAPDCITLSVEGDLGRGTAVMKEGVSIDSCVAVTSSYSLRYLATYSKGASLCPTVLIQMGKETPLCLTYFVDAESPDHGRLKFFLAPRICD